MRGKIVVPDGMISAAQSAIDYDRYKGDVNLRVCLEAALRWLSENPIAPSEGDCQRMWNETGLGNETSEDEFKAMAIYWQRRMFLAPEPEIPEDVNDLLHLNGGSWSQDVADLVLEAYRRGQKSQTDKPDVNQWSPALDAHNEQKPRR